MQKSRCDDSAGLQQLILRYCEVVRFDASALCRDKDAPARDIIASRQPVPRQRQAVTAWCKYLTTLYFDLAGAPFRRAICYV